MLKPIKFINTVVNLPKPVTKPNIIEQYLGTVTEADVLQCGDNEIIIQIELKNELLIDDFEEIFSKWLEFYKLNFDQLLNSASYLGFYAISEIDLDGNTRYCNIKLLCLSMGSDSAILRLTIKPIEVSLHE